MSARGSPGCFQGRSWFVPLPELPGLCWNQPHNISFPSQSDVPENNVFPRQRRVPDDGEGSQGPAGCRLMFPGHPGPLQPCSFLGDDGMAASLSCPCPRPHPLPHVWPTQGPRSPNPADPCPGLPLLPKPAQGPWHDPCRGWDMSLLGRPASHRVSPS